MMTKIIPIMRNKAMLLTISTHVIPYSHFFGSIPHQYLLNEQSYDDSESPDDRSVSAKFVHKLAPYAT